MNMGMSIHAYGEYAHACAYGCMGAWVYEVGFIQVTIINTQVQANGLHAQKMLSILGSIANMVGGDLYHYFMSKKFSLQ
jgi:hypothetical protein